MSTHSISRGGEGSRNLFASSSPVSSAARARSVRAAYAAAAFDAMRSNAGRFGDAADSITPAKRARLVAAAREYLAGMPRTPACRFDVVLLDGLDPSRVVWLPDAFGAEE